MKLALLKKIRVIISLIFITLTSILFIDFSFTLPAEIADLITYLQFFPSLLNFINLLSLSAAGFIIVLILTLLFGRIYCSTICPLGILQDVVIFISKKIQKRKRFKYSKAQNVLRYSILVLSVGVFFSGSLFLLYIIDPFSLFGRIMANIIRPIFMVANNGAASILESFDTYILYPIDLKGVEIGVLIIPVLLFALVLWLSYTRGRLYCNTVCPVGTFLGLVSKFSLFKIDINQSTCTHCGQCEKVCKSACIDSKNQFIDFTRCIACYNCFDVCPTNGLEYKFSFRSEKENGDINNSKRDFLKKTAVYLLGAAGVAYAQQKKIEVYVMSKVPVIREHAICPPGSKAIDYFTGKCTACHLCVSACPTQVLQPSFLEYGFFGMLQPRMDNHKGFCNYECTICGDVCPTGAIFPTILEEKKLIQIGKVKFIKENCIFENQGSDCGACAEHCPTKAVYMVPYENPKYPDKVMKIPEVNDEICIGCGACEYACPAIPYKAIYVASNPVHLTAKQPDLEKIEEEINYEEDFPF